MDEIKRKILFRNSRLQEQALDKLKGLIASRCGERLTCASKQDVELQYLWTLLGNDSLVVDCACSDVLVALVTSNHLDFGYVLDGLLNVAPSVRKLNGVINGVTQLMCLQVQMQLKSTKSYKCPYSLRSPRHPYISLLTYRPDCWAVLLDNIVTLCFHHDLRIQQHSIEIVAPFVKYIFFDPSNTFCPLRLHLVHAVMSTPVSHAVVDLLTPLMPGLQVSVGHFTETLCIIETLAKGVLKLYLAQRDCRQRRGQLHTLSYHLLLLAVKMAKDETDNIGPLRLLLEIAHSCPEVLPCDDAVLPLAILSKSSLASHRFQIISLLQHILPAVQCRLLVASLLLPLVNMLSAGKMKSEQSDVCFRLIKDVHSRLEQLLCPQQAVTPGDQPPVDLSPGSYGAAVKLAVWLDQRGEESETWMVALSDHSGEMTSPISSPFVSPIVTGLLVCADSVQRMKAALNCLCAVAKCDPTQAVDLLTLMLYKLEHETDPECVHHILCSIPRLATHKVCVPKVLQALLSLRKYDPLTPSCLTHLTTLWRLEDRCYPHLAQVLAEKCHRLDRASQELKISVAMALKEVCTCRPELHGQDMLRLLSDVLNHCTTDEDAIPASLALQGIVSLCEAEVVDVMATWHALSTSLLTDQRSLVLQAMCSLCSLVPQLKVETPDYEEFTNQILDVLWAQSVNPDPSVAVSAFRNLAKFPHELFRITHLPQQVQETVNQAADEPDEVTVPGHSYIKLLSTVAPQVAPGCQDLVSSIIEREVKELPRSVLHPSDAPPTQGQADKSLTEIPSVVSRLYRGNQHPDMQQYIAVSLLLTFNPAVEKTRDGKPRRQNLVTRARTFREVAAMAIQQVPFERIIATRLSLSWRLFIERLYSACVDGYEAELELQLQAGKLDAKSKDQLQGRSWFYARDSITQLFTSTAVIGGPLAQANALLALCALCGHLIDRSPSARGQQDPADGSFQSLAQWSTAVLHTALSFVDQQFCCEDAMDLNQKRYGLTRASRLAESVAPLALSLIPSVLVTGPYDVQTIVSLLRSQLEGTCCSTEYPWMSPLGLASLVSSLLLTDADTSNQQMTSCIQACIHLYKDSCFSSDLSRVPPGMYTGMVVILRAMYQASSGPYCDTVKDVSHQMTAALLRANIKDASEELYECTAAVVSLALISNILDVTKVKDILSRLEKDYSANPKNTGLCLAIGHISLACGSLSLPDFNLTSEKYETEWQAHILKGDSTLACLNGLAALVGGDWIVSGGLLDLSTVKKASVSDVVKCLTNVVCSREADATAQGHALWLLVNIYVSMTGRGATATAAPSSYKYLPEGSVLKAAMDLLMSRDSQQDDLAILKLFDGIVLPPINWMSVLNPIMRTSPGSSVQTQCITVALQQMPTSPSAAQFVFSWALPPQLDSLNESSKKIIHCSALKLVRYGPKSKTKSFLRTVEQSVDGNEQCWDLIVTGLRDAIGEIGADNSDSVIEILVNWIPQNYKLYEVLAECLSYLPDATIDHLLETVSTKDLTQTLYMSAWLVRHGKQPIGILNHVIDATVRSMSNKCNINEVIASLFWCFSNLSNSGKDTSKAKQDWLVELIGHVKNVVAETKDDKLHEVYLLVVCTALCSWTGGSTRQLYAVCSSFQPQLLPTLLVHLPPSLCVMSALDNLVSDPSWTCLVPKLTTWLLHLKRNCQSKKVLAMVHESLLALRSSDYFKKEEVWTEVYQ